VRTASPSLSPRPPANERRPSLSQQSTAYSPQPEQPLKVHHILFIIWFIVFIAWMFKQFSDHNKRRDRK
jgi:flagellar biogenesis protein FliO